MKKLNDSLADGIHMFTMMVIVIAYSMIAVFKGLINSGSIYPWEEEFSTDKLLFTIFYLFSIGLYAGYLRTQYNMKKKINENFRELEKKIERLEKN